MREQWYADKRDLVKWATLIHIAKKERLKIILQVAMLRPSEKPEYLQISDAREEFCPLVWEHFRDLKAITTLGERVGVNIEVFDTPFLSQTKPYRNDASAREQFFQNVAEKLKALRSSPLLVFLDPDTGIAPKHCTAKHVSASEIANVFRSMNPKDWLGVYQHRPMRYTNNWKARAKRKFADAAEVPEGKVEAFWNEETAPDVVFFAVARKVRRTKHVG